MVAQAKNRNDAIRKARNLYKRFLALGSEQKKLDSAAIGEKAEEFAMVVNYFTNDGIRHVRALQVYKDLQALVNNWNLCDNEILEIE